MSFRLKTQWMMAGSLLLCASASLAAQGDSVVFVGIGQSGNWFTEMVLSNPDEDVKRFWIAQFPVFDPGPCPALCPFSGGDIAPKGTLQFDPEIIRMVTYTTVTAVYVSTDAGVPLPSVRARVVNGDNPIQAIEIPGTRLSTILAANPNQLSFPGAARSGTVRTNLILANIQPTDDGSGPDVTLRLEAFSAEGINVGSSELTLQYGESRFLIDVLSSPLHVPALAGGQIRVTRIGGTGVFWGTLCVTDTDGTVRVSPGRNP